MSNVNEVMTEQYLELDPSEVELPEVSNVRPYSTLAGDTEAEANAIQELAASIALNGQVQPIRVQRVVGENGSATYQVKMGRRRLQAIANINAGLKNGQPTLRVKAVVDNTPVGEDVMFRQAFTENFHRKGLSAMDLAMDIQLVRVNMGWKGGKGTKKVAEFLGVSPASVTQYDKLIGLDEETKGKLHSGLLSMDEALVLSKVPVEKRGEVLAAAENKHREELAAAADAEAEMGVAGGMGKSKKTSSKKTTRHVKDAARDVGVKTSRSRKDIISFFDGQDGPACGYPDGAARVFIAKFREYCAGELSERTFQKYWDALIEKAPKGSAASVVKDDDGVPLPKATTAARKKK